MSDWMIDPNLRHAQLFIDGLHWIRLTELAKERGVCVDKLIGAILEHALFRLGRIKYDEVSLSPLKVEVTLEPIREDKAFFDDLVKEREVLDKDRDIAEILSPEDTLQLDWNEL